MPAPASHIAINPFGNPHELMQLRATDHAMSTAPGLLNFGTDTNFSQSGYHPPPPALALDKDAEVRIKVHSALTRNESAFTTAANSPADIKDEPADSASPASDSSAPSPRPPKRRAEDGDDFTPSKAARHAHAHAPAAPAAAAAAATPKKKAAAAKRDNLTEAQKRENHIHSEQKRRNLIRQGFEELCALVPELKAGGYSKSAVLIHAANYLDDLKKGNAQLRIYLQNLETGAGQF